MPGRIVYAVTIAGISIFCSIVLLPPLRYTFYAFPLDLLLFVAWMVAFGLLVNLASGTCSSLWYQNYWGYYWGRFWVLYPPSLITGSLIGSTGCRQWRASIAWSFIGGFCWLINAFIGLYVILWNRSEERKLANAVKNGEKNKQQHSISTAASATPETEPV